METPYVVTMLAGAIGSMAAAIGLVWRNGEQKAQRIEDVWKGRVDDKDKENLWLREQLIAFRQDFATEAREDRAVMERLRETVQAATKPPSTRGAQ